MRKVGAFLLGLSVAIGGQALLASEPVASVMARDNPAPPEAASVRFVATGVERVIDADTFAIDREWTPWRYLDWSIRVRGIDTPESTWRAACAEERALGLRATEYAKALIAQHGHKVRVRNVAFDKYGGRLVADVALSDGSSYAGRLMVAGYARPYDGTGPKPDWCAIGERG